MAQRPPGRPKASEPRDVKVSIRFTEHEADVLCRLANEGSLSTAIRKAIERYVSSMGGWRTLPDTENALIRRELRKAKRMTSPEAEALAEVFALEEPAAPEPRVISLQVHYAETETVTRDFVDATGRVIARGTETRAKRP